MNETIIPAKSLGTYASQVVNCIDKTPTRKNERLTEPKKPGSEMVITLELFNLNLDSPEAELKDLK